MERWKGRVALVTGASSGIGRVIAATLLRHGLTVVGSARNTAPIEALRDEVVGEGVGRLLAVRCDLSKEEDILALFSRIKEELDGVDVCVNNAGVAENKNFRDGDVQMWRNMVNINILGLAICAQEALRSMKERGVDDGHIINIGSDSAHFVTPGWTFYCGTKFAVRGITDGIRQELLAEKSGIRVTEVSPEFVKTELIAKTMGEQGASDFLASSLYLLPQNVADGVVYALSCPRHVQVHEVLMFPVAKAEEE